MVALKKYIFSQIATRNPAPILWCGIMSFSSIVLNITTKFRNFFGHIRLLYPIFGTADFSFTVFFVWPRFKRLFHALFVCLIDLIYVYCRLI